MGPFLEVDLDDMSIVGRLKHRKTFEVTDRYHNDTIEAMCTVDQEILDHPLDHPLTEDKVRLGPGGCRWCKDTLRKKTL
jgi:hypothetical protein